MIQILLCFLAILSSERAMCAKPVVNDPFECEFVGRIQQYLSGLMARVKHRNYFNNTFDVGEEALLRRRGSGDLLVGTLVVGESACARKCTKDENPLPASNPSSDDIDCNCFRPSYVLPTTKKEM